MTADDLRIPSAANAATASAPLAANLSFPACPGQSRPARVVPGRSRVCLSPPDSSARAGGCGVRAGAPPHLTACPMSGASVLASGRFCHCLSRDPQRFAQPVRAGNLCRPNTQMADHRHCCHP
jgi:hypothetical protein